jgi:putative nucleotidyltransferase with HDIG domain
VACCISCREDRPCLADNEAEEEDRRVRLEILFYLPLKMDISFEPILTIYEIAQFRKEELYIVGGFIRDRLIGRSTEDIDFAVLGDPISLARDVADKMSGAFVLLDQKTARVVFSNFQCDFTKVDGTIQEDLKRRDFTINAIAVKVGDPEIVDPFDGIKDIRKERVCAISKENLLDDPLRLLRAVRLSASLGFIIEEKTEGFIKENAHLIKNVASERITYELFEILKTVNSADYLKLLADFGLLYNILPEMAGFSEIGPDGYHHLNLLDHSIEVVRQIEALVPNLSQFSEQRERVEEHLAEIIASNHTRLQLLKFAGLLHDMGKPETKKREDGRLRFIGHERIGANYISQIGRRMRLSSIEIESLKKLILSHMRIGTLIQGGVITKRAVFRLAKDLSDNLISALLLSLADRLSAVGSATTEQDVENHRDGIRRILKTYLSPTEPIKVPKIVNGYEIMERFNLSPSPLIGRLLELVEEAYIEQRVKTREDAMRVIKESLQNGEGLASHKKGSIL